MPVIDHLQAHGKGCPLDCNYAPPPPPVSCEHPFPGNNRRLGRLDLVPSSTRCQIVRAKRYKVQRAGSDVTEEVELPSEVDDGDAAGWMDAVHGVKGPCGPGVH